MKCKRLGIKLYNSKVAFIRMNFIKVFVFECLEFISKI
ncbi:hypothetical protein LEP1GSC198_3892 [Leptospira kirschneri str. JB]|nr:hypothetical protein LEP1GSC198_3892 [Leptospira kirschneri str. JB]